MDYRSIWRSNPEIAVKIARLKLTGSELPLYSISMRKDTFYPDEPAVEADAFDQAPDTVVTDLILLNERVEQLARLCERLLRENQTLREQQATLQVERDILHEKNEQSRARIDAMIIRLKGLGPGS